MLIACPECTTKFSIADAVLGDRGRKVRCFKCGHTWHQTPPGVAPEPIAPPMPAEAAPRPPTRPLMPPMPSVVAEPPAPAPAPEPVAPEPPAPAFVPSPALPLESSPVEGGFVPPAPPVAASGSLPLDSHPQAARPVADDFDIPNIANVDAGIASSNNNKNNDSVMDGVDVDALLGGSAEDISKVFDKRIKADEKKKGGVFGKLLFLVFLLGGAAAVLWFGRMPIVNRFPDTAKFYQMLGLPIEVLGEGLEFRGVTSEMTKKGRTPVLVVRGVVANMVPRERNVPLLRLVLLDSNGAVIQEAYAKARRDVLAKGAQVGFQISMKNPSGVAARYEVTFAESPAKSAEPTEVSTPPAHKQAPQAPVTHAPDPHAAPAHN